MSRCTRILALVLALFMLVLAGCSGSQKPAAPPAEPAKPAEPVTLNMWIMPNTSQSEQDMLDTLKPWLDQNKNVTVKVTVLDWGSAWTKITAAATSGEGPDVIQLGTTWVPAIAAMGALENLTDKVKDVGGKDAFLPAAWTTVGIAGKPEVWSVPWFSDVRLAYYRTDVFKKAGVDPAEAFKDWDSFKKALQKVNNTDIDGKKVAAIGFPGKNDWNVAHNIFPWIWGNGGSELSADLKSTTVDSDAAVDGLMFYTGLVQDGLVPKAVLEKNTADAENMFHTGELAVIFAGSYLIRHYYTPTDKGGGADTIAAKNYGVAPIPAGPKGRFTFMGGSNLSLWAKSAHKTEAWNLIKFLEGKDAQIVYAKFAGQLPSLKSAESDMVAFNKNFAAFYEAAKYGRAYPAIPQWGALEGVFTKHFATVWDITAGVQGTYSRDAIKKQLQECAKEATNLLKQ